MRDTLSARFWGGRGARRQGAAAERNRERSVRQLHQWPYAEFPATPARDRSISSRSTRCSSRTLAVAVIFGHAAPALRKSLRHVLRCSCWLPTCLSCWIS